MSVTISSKISKYHGLDVRLNELRAKHCASAKIWVTIEAVTSEMVRVDIVVHASTKKDSLEGCRLAAREICKGKSGIIWRSPVSQYLPPLECWAAACDYWVSPKRGKMKPYKHTKLPAEKPIDVPEWTIVGTKCVIGTDPYPDDRVGA